MFSFRCVCVCVLPAGLTRRRQYRRVVLPAETPSGVVVEGQAPPDGPVGKLKVVQATGRSQTWPAGAGKPSDTDNENRRPAPSESSRELLRGGEVIHRPCDGGFLAAHRPADE